MPAKSKRQFRLMQAAAHGKAKGKGLSKGEAAEFVKGQSPKGLPETAPTPREMISKGLKERKASRKRRK
jgi:hypothetical protein